MKSYLDVSWVCLKISTAIKQFWKTPRGCLKFNICHPKERKLSWTLFFNNGNSSYLFHTAFVSQSWISLQRKLIPYFPLYGQRDGGIARVSCSPQHLCRHSMLIEGSRWFGRVALKQNKNTVWGNNHMTCETFLKHGNGIMDLFKWSEFCNRNKTASTAMPRSSGLIAKAPPPALAAAEPHSSGCSEHFWLFTDW